MNMNQMFIIKKYKCSECGSLRNVDFWDAEGEYAAERKHIRLCRDCGHEKVIAVQTTSSSGSGRETQWNISDHRPEDEIIKF